MKVGSSQWDQHKETPPKELPGSIHCEKTQCKGDCV